MRYEAQRQAIHQKGWNDARSMITVLAICPYKRSDYKLAWYKGFMEWHKANDSLNIYRLLGQNNRVTQ